MVRLNGRLVVVTFVAGAIAAPLRAQTDSARASRPSVPASSTQPTASESFFAPSVAFTQVIQPPAGPPPTPRHTGIKAMLKELVVDVKNLPSLENLLWVGVGSGLALAVHPFDDDVNRKLT